MKKLVYKSVLIAFSILIFSSAVYGQGTTEKKKEISRQFNLKKITALGIDNKYGDIHVETWDKREITVLVTITARKYSESRAQELIDRVNIRISGDESSDMIRFVTDINGNINNRRNENFSIDYDVHMPKNSPIDVENKYGNLFLSTLNAKADIDVSYGKVRIEDLNAEANLDLAYGGGDIGKVYRGYIDISYSSLYLGESEDIEIKSQYTNIDFGKIGNLEITNKYGNLDIEEISEIDGESRYGGVKIGKLNKSLDLYLSYGGGVKIQEVANNFEKIEIDAEYATSSLSINSGAKATVEIDTRYGNLKYPDREFDFHHVNRSNNSASYRGNLGGQSGKGIIRVNSSYGSVVLDIR